MPDDVVVTRLYYAKPNQGHSFRPHEWINLDTKKPIYGIQAYHNGQWLHVAIKGVPAHYATAKKRDAAMAALAIRALIPAMETPDAG